MFARSGGTNPGRDGCRVPLPWSGDAPPFGFSPDGSVQKPWLPQPPGWARLTAAAQQGDPDSMLEFYRYALRIRRREEALGDGAMTWLPAPPGVLAFRREPGFVCQVNLSPDPVPLVPHDGVLLASGPLASSPLADGQLPPDMAVWLRG
jgi:alpha-glucosidase